MRLTDKRFWIFECSTVVYATVLLLIVYIFWGKPWTFTILPSVIVFSGVCGCITWLLANGKHWAVYGIIYEAVQLSVGSILFWMKYVMNRHGEVDEIDVMIFLYSIFVFVIITIFPTFALAFFGYKLFQKREKEIENK